MRILLVEDSRTSVRMVEGLLAEQEEQARFHFELTVAGTLSDAKNYFAQEKFDLVLLDLTLPDSFGLKTVEEVVKAAPYAPIIVLTSTSDEDLGLSALKKGAQDFLVKDETYRKVLVRSIRYAYQRNLAEQEIREAKELAEFATNSKSSFIANLSHELRTPLNAIIGFSEMMQSGIHGELGEKYSGYAKDINCSGRYLLGLIGTVLDMSKIEARKIDIQEEQVNLDILLNEILSDLQFKEAADGSRVKLDGIKGLPSIRGDEVKIRQIITNLVSNAVKYSPEGGDVCVAAALLPEGDLILKVSDNGIGIPEDQLGEVLKPFGRTEVSKINNIEGTGLGLSLTKGLVEAHGGNLKLESILGEGTTVTVTMPAERVIKSL